MSREETAVAAEQYYVKHPDKAVEAVINSGLSIKQIKHILRMAPGIDKNTVDEVVETVKRRRAAKKEVSQ